MLESSTIPRPYTDSVVQISFWHVIDGVHGRAKTRSGARNLSVAFAAAVLLLSHAFAQSLRDRQLHLRGLNKRAAAWPAALPVHPMTSWAAIKITLSHLTYGVDFAMCSASGLVC